jgi:hypothetical protein
MTRRWPRPAAVGILLAAAGLAVSLPTRPAAAQTGTLVVIAVGDISPPPAENKTDDMATAAIAIGANPHRILLAGDTQYERGELANYQSTRGFAASWGRPTLYNRTCPAIGNHEYLDPGVGAPGFFTYFGPRLAACANPGGRPDLGYYSFDLPNGWHVVALNSDCGRTDPAAPACSAGSAQVTWLQADLQAHAASRCMLAYWHHPRWGSGFFGDDANVALFWSALNHVHADLIVDGHEHHYARFGPMTPQGHLSPTGAGIRQITVGTGGRSLLGSRIPPHPEGIRYRDFDHYGVIRLALSPTGWSTEFRRTDGVIADRAAAGCWQ